MAKPNMNMIAIQTEYIETVNSGYLRWSHRKDGGHFSRIKRGAYNRARKALLRTGYNEMMVTEIIGDAWDMAVLERNAVTE